MHLQNPLIPRKRWPQGHIEHWFDLKREEKMGTLNIYIYIYIYEREKRLSIFIKGE